MGIANLPIFQALKSKMDWHQTRQKLLAENVANAETPGYRARDLEAFSFESVLKGQGARSIATATTNARHISSANSGNEGFVSRSNAKFEVTPDGNSVVLEEEMMKVASNQMDYQAATSLYSRSLKLIRSAIGRNA
ncbi:MAG TPA: flagellar basal body rod protein FlgB [Devosia sp.]|nr:flagellar basal body rod protein FlgB [Devosia sp.]